MTTSKQLADARAELIEAGAQCNTAQQRLIRAVNTADRHDLYVADGANSTAAWVAALLDVETCTAREWVRVARALADLPAIDAAFAAGILSYSKVRTLTRVATPASETELLELADTCPANGLHRTIALWRASRETPDDTEARQHHARSFTTWTDHDGMICGHFRLPPLTGGTLIAAIETDLLRHPPTRTAQPSANTPPSHHDASADAPRPHCPTLAEQRADALARLCHTSAQPTYEVILHVRADGDTLHDGTPIPRSITERIAPHAFIRTLIHDAESRPINASRRHRHPNTRQRRVIDERQPHCIDCGSTDLLEYDHEPAYETTGHTLIDELNRRCAPCHRQRHQTAA